MVRSIEPLHGIKHVPGDGWQVWSHLLQYPIRCGSADDANRIVRALELAYPHGGPVDYTQVDAVGFVRALGSCGAPIPTV